MAAIMAEDGTEAGGIMGAKTGGLEARLLAEIIMEEEGLGGRGEAEVMEDSEAARSLPTGTGTRPVTNIFNLLFNPLM